MVMVNLGVPEKLVVLGLAHWHLDAAQLHVGCVDGLELQPVPIEVVAVRDLPPCQKRIGPCQLRGENESLVGIQEVALLASESQLVSEVLEGDRGFFWAAGLGEDQTDPLGRGRIADVKVGAALVPHADGEGCP